jgi:hypothetical protein
MQGRHRVLSICMKGADVVQLQEQLQRLGYIIPQNEIEKRYFGHDEGTNGCRGMYHRTDCMIC